MISRTIENIFRKLLPIERYAFKKYTRKLGLQLDYRENKEGINIFSEVFVQKYYAPYFPFYEKAVIVDAGAHFGYFSLFAAMNTAAGSRVLALEPSPSNFAQLQKNLSANSLKNIEALPIGLGAQSERKAIYGRRSFNHSLFSDSADSSPIADAEILSLQDLMQQYSLSHIDFLKMDCEGAEYPALLNAATSVLENIGTIALEFHDLREHGYRPQQLVEKLRACGFEIAEYSFSPNYSGTRHNFGKIIGTRWK